MNLKNYRNLTQVSNNDAVQLYLILKLLYYTLKRLGDTGTVVSWKTKSSSDKNLTTPTTTNSLSSSVNW